MLKDDKSYPYIVVKNEYFPRIYKTRNVVKDGSRYFGPLRRCNQSMHYWIW